MLPSSNWKERNIKKYIWWFHCRVCDGVYEKDEMRWVEYEQAYRSPNFDGKLEGQGQCKTCNQYENENEARLMKDEVMKLAPFRKKELKRIKYYQALVD